MFFVCKLNAFGQNVSRFIFDRRCLSTRSGSLQIARRPALISLHGSDVWIRLGVRFDGANVKYFATFLTSDKNQHRFKCMIFFCLSLMPVLWPRFTLQPAPYGIRRSNEKVRSFSIIMNMPQNAGRGNAFFSIMRSLHKSQRTAREIVEFYFFPVNYYRRNGPSSCTNQNHFFIRLFYFSQVEQPENE